MSFKILKNYNFEKMDKFFLKYEKSLKYIYINYYCKHGKGILNVDINKISSEGCSTSYIPLKNRDKFWNQSKDIINIKKAVNFDKLAKYYIWLIDNDISIFFERDCAIKILMLKKLKLTQINKEDKDIKDSNDNTKNDTKENIEIDKIDKIDKIEEKYESSDDEDELLYQMFNINY